MGGKWLILKNIWIKLSACTFLVVKHFIVSPQANNPTLTNADHSKVVHNECIHGAACS